MTDDEDKITSNENEENSKSSRTSTGIGKNTANLQSIEVKLKKDIATSEINENEDNKDIMDIENNDFTSAKSDSTETTNQNGTSCKKTSQVDITNVNTIQAEMNANDKRTVEDQLTSNVDDTSGSKNRNAVNLDEKL